MAIATKSYASTGFNQHSPTNLICEQVTVSLATTNIDNADDGVVFYQFPSAAYLWDLSVYATDMDTNATPTLVFDVGIGDSDGAVDTVLINDTTIGQGAGRDDLDATVQKWVNCSSKYLMIDIVTAAATAAAGTLTVSFIYTENLHTLSG